MREITERRATATASEQEISCLRFIPLAIGVLLAFAPHVAHSQVSPDISSRLAAVDNATPDSPVLKTPEQIKQAFDNCIRENTKTEFDTAETLLARATKAPAALVASPSSMVVETSYQVICYSTTLNVN